MSGSDGEAEDQRREGEQAQHARGMTVELDVTPTPDDGTRLSRDVRWDESTRPTRQPADGARYTARGKGAARQLIAVHDHLRAELAQLRSLIAEVRVGERNVGDARAAINEMTMRQKNWSLGAYCESYCRLVTTHHSLEDAMLFPALRAREKDLEPVIDRLAEEHGVIHEVLNEVDQALVTFTNSPTAVDQVAGTVDVLTDTLLSHLSYEERELVEPLSRYGMHGAGV